MTTKKLLQVLLKRCVKKQHKKLFQVLLRVFACNSGTQMRVRDSSATRIFF